MATHGEKTITDNQKQYEYAVLNHKTEQK